MMKKKGFTLVELLAVIAILTVLVIIALPNVVELFNTSKMNSFIEETKNIYKAAQEQYVKDSIKSSGNLYYARVNDNNCSKQLKLSGRSNVEYFIKLDKKGKVIALYTTDGTYQYSYSGNELKIENIKDAKQISKITNGRLVSVTCTGGKVASNPPSSTNDYLMEGSSGTPTSNYLRTTIKRNNIEKITFADSIEGHTANGTDCWDVSKGQTGAVLAWATDTNNNGLFELTIGANGEVYATNGSHLFYNLINLESINGMVNLNTSKTTSMSYMFACCDKLNSIDLSYFDTSNVIYMDGMFRGRYEKYYSAGNGSGSIYYDIFGSLTSLNLSSFDTSNVTSMRNMFDGQHKLRNIIFGSWNTSKVTNMSFMFTGCINLETIDLSGFDTSNVTNMQQMFSLPLTCDADFVCGFRFDGEMFYSVLQGANNDQISFDHPNMKIKTIYASNMFSTSSVMYDFNMFLTAPNLVGGSGTIYSEDHVDKTYAHIDGGPSNPGYFTRK